MVVPIFSPGQAPDDPGQPDQRIGPRPREHLGQPQRVEAAPGDPLPQRDDLFGTEALAARADADADLHGLVPPGAAVNGPAPADAASSTSWWVTKRTISGAMACASTP